MDRAKVNRFAKSKSKAPSIAEGMFASGEDYNTAYKPLPSGSPVSMKYATLSSDESGYVTVDGKKYRNVNELTPDKKGWADYGLLIPDNVDAYSYSNAKDIPGAIRRKGSPKYPSLLDLIFNRDPGVN